MRIWYQSFADRASAPSYLRELEKFVTANAASDTEVVFKEVTPPDAYAHAVSEWRCGREAIANAITASDENYDGFLIGENFMKTSRPEQTCLNFIKEIDALLQKH